MLWLAFVAVALVVAVIAFGRYTANEPKRNPHLRVRPFAPSAPAESSARVGGAALTATVGVREMTQLEVDEAHDWYTKAFDWVMRDVTISDADRRMLLSSLLPRWNNSRVDTKTLEASGIALSWPRAEAYIRNQHASAHEEALADLDGMDEEEALQGLKAAELKVLMQKHQLTTKGRATKAAMMAALLSLDSATRRAIRDGIVAQFKRQAPDPGVATKRELVELLHRRVVRAAHRMRRAAQVCELLAGGGVYDYTHIKVDAFMADEGRAPCGLRHGEVRPAVKLLDRVEQPLCESFDCCCGFSPHSPEREARRAKLS